MHRRAALATAFLIPWLAACGATASGPPATPTPMPTATPGATVVATPTPTATETVAACPAAGVIPSGPLPSCTYAIPVGAHTATFSIAGSGWFGKRYPGGVELTRQAPFGVFSLTTFTGRVYADPCIGAKTTTIEASPKSFIDFIAASKQLVAAEPVAATFAGAAASQLDVTADGTPTCPDGILLWALGPLGNEGVFDVANNEAVRFAAAEIGGETIVWALETSSASDQVTFLAVLQPVLDSMTMQ